MTVWPATVNVPIRAAPVLAAAVNATDPLPEGFGPEVIVNHVAFVAALQEHLVCVVTEICGPGPPAAATDGFNGVTVNEQEVGAGVGVGVGDGPGVGDGEGVGVVGVGGTGGVGVGVGVGDDGGEGSGGGGAPSCVTVTVCPPIVIGAVRVVVALLTPTVKRTVPGPLPVLPLVRVIHPSPALAVHGQPFATLTPMLPLPPAAGTVWSVVENSKRHGAASWRIRPRSLFTTMSPWRAVPSGLAATCSCSCPLP